MNGSIIRKKGEGYQGVSMVGQSRLIEDLFEEEGVEIWSKTIDLLDDKKRYDYYLGQDTSLEISNIFNQIKTCRLPNTNELVHELKII